MITIREYREADAESVGVLIADTFSKFNLSFAPSEDRPLFLGPFQHARSPLPEHQKSIARVLRAAMVFVADDDGQIAGILRGRRDKLQTLFVREDYHRQGVGRRLVERFEQECRREGADEIKVMATRYAVPFYLAVGYKRTTGVRRMRSFDGEGLEYQPMKKTLKPADPRFLTYKRWMLKPGREESELVALVRGEIIPHYHKLAGCRGLGLHRIEGTRSYLAIQRWESRAAWEATTSSEFYRSWLEEYEPILARWDTLMEFEDEWEAEDVLGER